MFLVSICRLGILEPAVELRHLRYFVAVAEMENVSRAALKLHVSQPALSRQIRDLEDEIGFSLLERTAKSVRLTDAGRAFLDNARALLQNADDAVTKARAVASAEPDRKSTRLNSVTDVSHLSLHDALPICGAEVACLAARAQPANPRSRRRNWIFLARTHGQVSSVDRCRPGVPRQCARVIAKRGRCRHESARGCKRRARSEEHTSELRHRCIAPFPTRRSSDLRR